jgi:hypothetical protein
MTTEEVSLKHKITDREMADLAREQAEALQSKSVAESDLKSISTAYKAKIEEAQAKVNGLSARIQAGYEFKNVRCIIANERPEGYRITIRLDSGHISTRRKLAQEERQIKLTDINDPFMAVALLMVDDETWETDLFQCPVRQDEFDALRMLPDVKMQDLKPTRAQLSDGKKDKKEK